MSTRLEAVLLAKHGEFLAERTGDFDPFNDISQLHVWDEGTHQSGKHIELRLPAES